MEDVTQSYNTIQGYNVLIGHPNGQPFNFFINSEKNLIQEYKDALLMKNKLLVWENGCVEMVNVLGVFI